MNKLQQILDPLFRLSRNALVDNARMAELGQAVLEQIRALPAAQLHQEEKEELLGLLRPFLAPDPEMRGEIIVRLRRFFQRGRSAAQAPVIDDILALGVRRLHGIGSRLELRLAARGLTRVGDFLYTLPKRYEDRRVLTPLAKLQVGNTVSVMGRVEQIQSALWRRYRRRTFEVIIADESGGQVKLKWFNMREHFFKGKLRKGIFLLASGVVREFHEALEIHHPDFETLQPGQEEAASAGRIIPIYPELAALRPKVIRKLQQQALTLLASAAPDPPLPELLRPASFSFLPRLEALRRLHAPQGDDLGGLADAARSLAYEEMLLYLLALGRRSAERQAAQGTSHRAPGLLRQRFLAALPFTLTGEQEKAAAEILEDMAAPRPMNRLLQGDVGSGKTAVAALAILQALECGRQAALMVPTEILAEQHARFFERYFQPLQLPVFLLTGSTPAVERKAAAQALESGKPALAIGTQALLSKGVAFSNLGLAVVDEQHRFGVLQRRELAEKTPWPDTLILSATPIPRSLALTVFGDTEISRIEHLPAGRQVAPTEMLGRHQWPYLIGEIACRLQRNERSFVVAPLIETNEELQVSGILEWHDYLTKNHLPPHRVALLHGGMPAATKEQILRRFRDGEYGVLISTPLIEVGIDIPQATLMAILYPERFGLAQLHQLRGRVGRGALPGKCLLVLSDENNVESRQRLDLFADSSNGFELAEFDLRLRGSGTLAGIHQTGGHEFRLASLPRDVDLFVEAAQRVKEVLRQNPALAGDPFDSLRQRIDRFWAEKIDLAQIA